MHRPKLRAGTWALIAVVGSWLCLFVLIAAGYIAIQIFESARVRFGNGIFLVIAGLLIVAGSAYQWLVQYRRIRGEYDERNSSDD